MDRRSLIQGAIAAALLPRAGFARHRGGVALTQITFDYYISTTGDDDNAGTLESPWSITALNSKYATYAGKSIGLIAGTYQYGTIGGVQTTLYSMYQSLPSATLGTTLLNVQGGPSGSQPTYIASCNSSGVYSARAAIIDCSQPGTGDLPTVSGQIMGQYIYQEPEGYPVTQFGNVTIDGLVIRNGTFSSLAFYGNEENYVNNVVIENCELYNNQNVVSDNNPGAIWIDGAPDGVTVTNNLIHDLLSNASGTSSTMQNLGYIQFNSGTTTPSEITNNTFYNCCAVSNKNGWQGMNVSYNYLGLGTFGVPLGTYYDGTVQNYLCATSQTVSFHHNIVMGCLACAGESGQANEGTVLIYNNTWFMAAGTNNHGIDAFVDTGVVTSGGTGSFDFYNNLVYSLNSPPYDGVENSQNLGAITKQGANTGGTNSTWTANYNAYGTGMTFGWGESEGQYALSLSTWQTYGYDANSILLTANPFTGTPTEAEYETFAISGPAATAGMGGACCGAVDGSGPVGCNFESIEGWPPA